MGSWDVRDVRDVGRGSVGHCHVRCGGVDIATQSEGCGDVGRQGREGRRDVGGGTLSSQCAGADVATESEGCGDVGRQGREGRRDVGAWDIVM